jgi:hypothetical protein
MLRSLKLLVGCGLTVQDCDSLTLNLSKLARQQQNFGLARPRGSAGQGGGSRVFLTPPGIFLPPSIRL